MAEFLLHKNLVSFYPYKYEKITSKFDLKIPEANFGLYNFYEKLIL